MREAIILAGGLGSRLANIVKDVPKPLALVKGKPVVTYILEKLCASGVEKITFAVSFRANDILNYYGDSFLGVPLQYSIEELPLGTGGGLLRALQNVHSEYVLTCNADTLTEIDYQDLYEQTRNIGLSTIVVKQQRDIGRYSSVNFDQKNQVTSFETKIEGVSSLTSGSGISVGTYCFRVADMKQYMQRQGVFSLESVLLPDLCAKTLLSVYAYDGFFIDVGVPEDYSRAQILEHI